MANKLCHMYTTFITVLSSNDDKFMALPVLNGEEGESAIIYVHNGLMFVPKCEVIQSIDIDKNNELVR